MNFEPTAIKHEIEKGIERIGALRDEVRVKIHLAGMDAKDEWNKLETHLLDVEKTASEVSENTRAAVAKAVHSLSEFVGKLH